MDGGVIEEHAVAAGVELEADDELLVGPPIRIVHASRLVPAAIPRGQGRSIASLLTPLGRFRMKPGAQVRWPVTIESFQVHDRSGAHVTNGQPKAVVFRATQIARRRLAFPPQPLRAWQPVIAQTTEPRDINDMRSSRNGRVSLLANRAEMIERMSGDPNPKLRWHSRGSRKGEKGKSGESQIWHE